MNKKLTSKSTRPVTINDIFVYLLFLAMVIAASIINSNFFSVTNFTTIAKQTATTAVVAFGMTFVITSGQIDLSIGGVVAMVGMLVAMVVDAGGSILLATTVGVAGGVVIGLVNGLLISKLQLPAFLATLGTSSICEGIAKTVTKQQVVTLYSEEFGDFWGRATVLGVPSCILWMFLFFIITMFIYRFTTFGNHVKAVGGNMKAARFSGVQVDKVIIITMLISGVCAAISGILFVSRLGQGRPDIGTTLGLDAITAVVLGGTPFTGGRGSVATSLIGSFVIITLTNALVIMGIPTTAQLIVKGVIVIVAVTLSTRNIVLFGGQKKADGAAAAR